MSSRMIVLSLIFTVCIFYMTYTLSFYKYCELSTKEQDSQNANDPYRILCNEVYTNYSNHTLLKQTINNLYELVLSQTKLDKEEIETSIKKVDVVSLRFMMKLLKIVHFTLYGCLLYFLIVILPELLMKLIKYIVTKVLFIVFFVFILDALFKIYFDINIDVLRFFDKSYYMEMSFVVHVIDLFKFFYRLF
jgi:hypothetical protein